MSDYQPTEADVRTAMLNRGFTEAEVSELLNNIKAEVWDEGRASVGEQERHFRPKRPQLPRQHWDRA